MSHPNKFHPSLFFVLVLLGLALFFSQAACTQPQKTAATSALSTVMDGVDAALVEPNELVFAGQIADANGRWQNDYVIVLFKNGVEIARTTSRLHDVTLSGSGPMDGVFELVVPNEYKLGETHKYYDGGNNLIPMRTVSGLLGTQYIGRWFGELHPNDKQIIQVHAKQVTYSLVVLAYTQDELPESHFPGNLSLDGNILVTNLNGGRGGGDVAGMATAVSIPNPAPQTNIQLTISPSGNSGLVWDLHMTGYYGNRWDVWERYVAGRVPGLSWEVFKEAVLVYNPHLQSDGFVFYPEKMYRLPNYR